METKFRWRRTDSGAGFFYKAQIDQALELGDEDVDFILDPSSRVAEEGLKVAKAAGAKSYRGSIPTSH
jgi:hypothetical protein